MDKRIRLTKTVLDKNQFDKSIDSSFKTFVKEEEVIDQDTVQEFFRLYEKLYYEIPVQGGENSHEFLIKESSKLATVEKDNEEIDPLLEEITDLQERVLQLNQELISKELEETNNANDQL
tara:strand:- start:1324 stop:1683 length:360 start_codon:yes stop_codon:yes gene_type:complete